MIARRLPALFSVMALLAAMSAPTAAGAAPTHFPARGLGVDVAVDVPATGQLQLVDSSTAYRYVGNAERFNLSIFVDDPWCTNGVTAQDAAECLATHLNQVPGLLPQSVRFNRTKLGTQATYVTKIPVNGRDVMMLHTHLFFTAKSKWGEIHASFISPKPDEVELLVGLGDRVQVRP